jgi:hypothetical protein
MPRTGRVSASTYAAVTSRVRGSIDGMVPPLARMSPSARTSAECCSKRSCRQSTPNAIASGPTGSPVMSRAALASTAYVEPLPSRTVWFTWVARNESSTAAELGPNGSTTPESRIGRIADSRTQPSV